MAKGDADRAQQLGDEANDMSRRAGDIWTLAFGLVTAAVLRINRKDFASARAHLSEALSLNEELEDPRGIASTLEAIAGLLVAQNRFDGAIQLWAATDTIERTIGMARPPFLKWMRDRARDNVEASVGHVAFEAAVAEGRRMSATQATAVARRQLELIQ